jgi:alpha,alpha-trehalase
MSMAKRVPISSDSFDAVIFDLDGVITDTARVHAAAWTRLFDDYLAVHAPDGVDAAPFSHEEYLLHVDGRSRIDGVETFLAARGIHLPRGTPDDPPEGATAWSLANRKNLLFRESLAVDGVETFTDAVQAVEAIRAGGLHTAVVTASRNRAEVLAAAGLSDLFDVSVDGLDCAALELPGKPDPAPFLEAARRLGIDPARAVLVEDALPGVEAGRRGSFGLVIGVDRHGDGAQLLDHGADVAVADLSVITVEPIHQDRRA